MIQKRGQMGFFIDAMTLPKWLLYPLIILICFTLLAVVFFLGIVGYSCIKGNCNGYYGMGWFGYPGYHIGPSVMVGSHTFQTQDCFVNGIKTNCSEMNKYG